LLVESKKKNGQQKEKQTNKQKTKNPALQQKYKLHTSRQIVQDKSKYYVVSDSNRKHTHTHTRAQNTHSRITSQRARSPESVKEIRERRWRCRRMGRSNGPKGMAGCVLCVGGEDGPLCKREQLSPPVQFSKAPEHCGTAVGPSVGPIPL
jgi:hypothetical protein